MSVNLNIHLDCRDTFVGTCNLKVHISEEILKSLDIRKHQIVIICFAGYQTC